MSLVARTFAERFSPQRWLRTRFGGFYFWALLNLLGLMLLRTALLVGTSRQVAFGWSDLVRIYAIGLVFDMATYFYYITPAVLWLVVIPDRLYRSRVNRWFSLVLYGLAVFVLLFDMAAEWFFWDEYGHRFNFIVVDYLLYTHEFFQNLFESYPVKTIVAGLAALTAGIVWLTRKYPLLSMESETTLGQRFRTGLVFVAILAACHGFVGSSMADFSHNFYANELSKNGLYSLVDAFWTNSLDYDRFYQTFDPRLAFGRVCDRLEADGSRPATENPYDLTREIRSPGPEKRHNVMIAVVESLSAEFLGCFGSKQGLTPNLDRLARQSLLFTNLYATGTRTVRGIEAIVLSIPPMPGYGGIKRPDLGRVFCLPRLFQERGYDFAFLYSGYSYFDNFKSFFTNQGCRVVDRGDMTADEIKFATIWGVCDGDIYRRAAKEADAAYARKTPFCYLVDTCSNHRPYAYPQEIDIPSGSGRAGAVKYADHAVGRLVAEARAKPWFDNTIFVVIADHCAASAGKTDLPYHRYHIPMLIYAPKLVPPGRCDWLASQIDVGPTLLGLLSFSYTSKFFGQDVLRAPPHRAFIGTYQKLGLLTDEKLGVLSVGRRFDTYRVAPPASQRPAEPDKDLLQDAASYYQAANWLLKNHAYR